jgi:hypothetical protein
MEISPEKSLKCIFVQFYSFAAKTKEDHRRVFERSVGNSYTILPESPE